MSTLGMLRNYIPSAYDWAEAVAGWGLDSAGKERTDENIKKTARNILAGGFDVSMALAVWGVFQATLFASPLTGIVYGAVALGIRFAVKPMLNRLDRDEKNNLSIRIGEFVIWKRFK